MSSHVAFIPSGDPGYAPPLLRAPSPSSSIGTTYDADETPEDELRLSDKEFAKMCEDKLQLGRPGPDEERANRDPLLPRPRSREEEDSTSRCHRLNKPSAEEVCAEMLAVIMQHLRQQVRDLEENNIFEQTVLRGSFVTEERQPTADIDAIMRSMMGPETSISLPVNNEPFSPKPSFPPPSIAQSSAAILQDFFVEPTSPIASTPAVSRLRPRNKGKVRRP
ncbi:hypothetical protein EIP86_007468 [Pleurotus ostreatoroseus]|nr:hypothetical protein EIP86_007468 [Pleurotus ostreatoroseus]